jgi:hypothetical protein
VTKRLDYEKARKRDYILEHGSVRAEAEHRRRSRSTVYRKARRKTTCRLCGRDLIRGQRYYPLTPGALCRDCARALLQSGDLPTERQTAAAKSKLKRVRDRIASGQLKPPPRPVKSTSKQPQETRPARVRRELTPAEVKEHFVAQQARIKAHGERQRAVKQRSIKKKPGS